MADIDPRLIAALQGEQPTLSDRMINYHLGRGQAGLNTLMNMIQSDADGVALARQMYARGLVVPQEILPKDYVEQLKAEALFGKPQRGVGGAMGRVGAAVPVAESPMTNMVPRGKYPTWQ